MIRKQKIILDIGGAASPIVLAEKKRNSLNIIVDKLEGYNEKTFVDNLSKAVYEKNAQLVRYELTKNSSLPFKEDCVDHVHCRQVYEGGIIINPALVASESHRVLKKGGTVTMSGRLSDRANVVSAFKKQGFNIDGESKKPQTWFEKRDSTVLLEMSQKKADDFEKVLGDKDIPSSLKDYYRKEIERLRKRSADLFIIKFKK